VRFHLPTFLRYRVADAGFRAGLNRYPKHPSIGAYVVVGRWAYCVKWATLGLRRAIEGQPGQPGTEKES
jgi:hypothetical protein